jgi:formylglycine-generating enzyme required for sulfatase activity
MRTWTKRFWLASGAWLVPSTVTVLALWWSGSLGAALAQPHCPRGRLQSCTPAQRDDAGCCRAPRARTGRLTVRARGAGGAPLPSDARVMVDGEEPRTLPLQRLRLSLGQHRLVVTAPGYEPHEETVELGAEGETLSIRMTRATVPPVTTPPAVVPPVTTPPAPAGMVLIPDATFMMGSPSGETNERPVRRITLSSYYMDSTEVTVAAYGECVRAGRCIERRTVLLRGSGDSAFWSVYCNGGVSGRSEHPMNCVNWEDAVGYCGWVGKRLPTEAEWEYAARGGDGRLYPWGDGAPSRFCDVDCLAEVARTGGSDGWGGTRPVGRVAHQRSPFGLYDMSGNVWEWVSDWYGPYSGDDLRNPSGPSSGVDRVERGGSFGTIPVGVPSAYRSSSPPSARFYGTGFRCARGA